jgi:hypothetical protein
MVFREGIEIAKKEVAELTYAEDVRQFQPGATPQEIVSDELPNVESVGENGALTFRERLQRSRDV